MSSIIIIVSDDTDVIISKEGQENEYAATAKDKLMDSVSEMFGYTKEDIRRFGEVDRALIGDIYPHENED